MAPLYTNAFYLWANAAGTAVAGLVFWGLAARLYDAEAIGLAAAALSALTLLALFSNLGLGLGLVRFLPESGARGPRLTNVVFTSSAVVAVVVSIVFLVGLTLSGSSLYFLRGQPWNWVAFISLVVAATLYFVQMYAFTSIRRTKYTLVQLVFVQLSRPVLLALAAASFGTVGIVASWSIVASWGIAVAFGAVAGFVLLARGLKGYRPRAVIDAASLFTLLPFSVANHVADFLLLMPGLLLPLVVVGVLGPDKGAYFYLAWLLGYMLTSASAHLALSLVAEGSSHPGALPRLSSKALLAGVALAAVGTLCFLLLGDKLLLAFGRDYAAEGATLLRLVALAALPAAVVNVYLGALRVTKRVGELVIIAGLVAVTTLVLSSALLPVMGLTGAGIGLGLGQGLGMCIVLARLLAVPEGTMPQRMRWLLVNFSRQS